MARIRNIKPDFWTDEKLVELEPWERLLFIGLWNFADDEGYMPYSPKRIKMQIFPGDSLEVSRGLQNLISVGSLTLYDSEVGQVIRITNWIKHQKVSNPTKSKYRDLAIESDEANPLDVGAFGVEGQQKFVKSTEDSRNVHKEREGEVEVEVNKDLSSKPDEFAQWYAKYPKKEAKESARKAFVKARKVASMESLMSGLDRYVMAMRGQERKFIALPATWLNAGRWDDEPMQPQQSAPAQVASQHGWAN